MGGGLFDFRVTPNPNFMLDVNLDVEFDNCPPPPRVPVYESHWVNICQQSHVSIYCLLLSDHNHSRFH